MALTKLKKVEILERLKDIFKNSKSIVFVNFHGLPVLDTGNMRGALRGQDVGYFVAKKTLIKKALSDSDIDGEIPELPGEIAVAYLSSKVDSEDITAPPREVYEFVKKNKDNIAIVGGVFESKYMNMAEMSEIALIPSLQTLYAQFVNVINSPIQGFAVALNQIAEAKA